MIGAEAGIPLRIVPELRAVHLERRRRGAPARLLYFAPNYDLQGVDVPDDIERVGLARALLAVMTSDAETLELPEPLWMRFLPTNVALGLTWKVAGVARRRRRRLVTYAMENNDLSSLVGGRRRVPRGFEGLFRLAVGAYVGATHDRIAFASEGSRALYSTLPFTGGVSGRLLLELPTAFAPAESEPNDSTRARFDATAAGSVLFVGALEPRKGLHALMRAWPAVERRRPDARLTITGSGPLAATVAAWAAEAPRSREFTGFASRDEVRRGMANAGILVAPSLRDGRWREQIGLPIKEALSVGMLVVTTPETGLSPWLAAQGHRVLAVTGDSAASDAAASGDGAGDVAEEFVSALAEALVGALDSEAVGGPSGTAARRRARRDDLPPVDGRAASEAWLLSPFE